MCVAAIVCLVLRVSGGETFSASGSVVVRPGFTAIMPWKVGGG
jgi:hypothetical protein